MSACSSRRAETPIRCTYESGLGEFRVSSFARCDRFGRVTESPGFVYFSIDGRWVYTDDYDQHRTGGSSGTRSSLDDNIGDWHSPSSP